MLVSVLSQAFSSALQIEITNCKNQQNLECIRLFGYYAIELNRVIHTWYFDRLQWFVVAMRLIVQYNDIQTICGKLTQMTFVLFIIVDGLLS